MLKFIFSGLPSSLLFEMSFLRSTYFFRWYSWYLLSTICSQTHCTKYEETTINRDNVTFSSNEWPMITMGWIESIDVSSLNKSQFAYWLERLLISKCSWGGLPNFTILVCTCSVQIIHFLLFKYRIIRIYSL